MRRALVSGDAAAAGAEVACPAAGDGVSRVGAAEAIGGVCRGPSDGATAAVVEDVWSRSARGVPGSARAGVAETIGAVFMAALAATASAARLLAVATASTSVSI